MGRVKVSMVPIIDNKKRSVAFKQRKAGLVKKARELAILCDVNFSMIIFSDQENNPEIFPLDDPRMLNDSINDYKSKRVSEPGKIRSYGLLDFFKDRKNKIEDDLAKAKKQNLEAKYPTRFGFLNNSSEGELRNFANFRLGMKIKEVKEKIVSLKKEKASMTRNVDVQGSLITTSSNESSLDHVKNCESSNPIYRVNPNSMVSMLMMGEDKNEYYRRMPMEHKKFVHGKVESYGDYYNKMLCMQSSNLVPISIDDSGYHDGANSGLPPLPETMPLLKQSPFMQMNSFMMSSFPSQVIN
ncbi:transcription factor, MADS-box [Artemisia annua]|uniref:Transcription factor, MADS-box n=1 Tax=Artemisia annua TaxID=35608 RepID=A0A2U1M8F1_ARTAN|nr:transcription factor, MADS-box [Artemisia annua]